MLGKARLASIGVSRRLHGHNNAGESGDEHAAAVTFAVSEAPLQPIIFVGGAVCTKIPYANRWLAQRALFALRAAGRPVQAIHPCFTDHPGAWHVTRKKPRRW